jgi:hypothetical protein
MWEVEEIPSNDKLFFRVHDNFIIDNELTPGVFREQGQGIKKGMSTNWEKYSTAEMLRVVAKNPNANSVVSFICGELRELHLDVTHDPDLENRAHTNVTKLEGPNETEIRLKLLDKISWHIRSERAAGMPY